MISTLSEALAERGFATLTAVQEAVTAPELAAADLLVSAQTGSGKTVGFGLAIAETLLGADTHFGPPAQPLALVVAPTRELALQVQRELAWLYQKAGARVVSCIGGMDPRDERRALERGAHIVVGTPGRLRDHITREALDLADIRAVVLDEADEMLDLGFREDLEFMLAAAPEGRRTLMFSATVPPSIAEMAKEFQTDAVRVTTLTGERQHADIAYQAVQVAGGDAENAIINLLRFHDAPNAIVFANTRAAVSRLTARFANRGFPVVSLSGELSQDERGHALQALRDGRAKVCVATDVAARGIDLPNLELVIHADLPTNTEALLHRSGRTGRAGRKGISALIVPDRAVPKARRLLGWAKIEAEWTVPPAPEEILAKDEARLLASEAWEAEPTEAEADFAARLLAEYGPERVAAACLRLYRAGLSAPEDLNTPGAKAKGDRPPFGPAVWFSLSVGRDTGAEPRWLLPLMLRTGALEKAQIGRIRVQGGETWVEVAEAAAGRLESKLGPTGQIEGEITARRMATPPADGPAPSRGQKPAPKPHRKGPRAEAPARSYGETTGRTASDAAADAPRDVAGAPDEAPRKPRVVAKKAKPVERSEGGKPFEKRAPRGGDSWARPETQRPARRFDPADDRGEVGAPEAAPGETREGKPFAKKPGKGGAKGYPKTGKKPGKPTGKAAGPKSKAGNTRRERSKIDRKGNAPPRRKG